MFPAHKKDWKKFESNKKTIGLNILHVPDNTEEIRHGYISKHDSMCKNQIVLLTTTDNKKWRFVAVTFFFVLFRGITLNHVGDSHCLNCLHSFRIENKLKEDENVCKITIVAIQKCLKKRKK